MDFLEACAFTHKLAIEKYTLAELDDYLAYLHTAPAIVVESLLDAHWSALDQSPSDSCYVSPSFMDKLRRLHPL